MIYNNYPTKLKYEMSVLYIHHADYTQAFADISTV